MADSPEPMTVYMGNTGIAAASVCLLFNAVASVLVILRLFVRTRMSKKFWPRRCDARSGLGWLLKPSLTQVLAIAVLAISLMSLFHYNLTEPCPTLTIDQQMQLTKLAYSYLVVSIIANMFVKLAIGLFLLRIFTTGRARSWIAYGSLIFVVATSVSAAIAVLSECRPIAKFFDPSVLGTRVSDMTRDAILYYQSTFSAVCDAMLAILPIAFLWDVYISRRKKVGICCLLGLGLLTVGVAVAKISEISQGDAIRSAVFVYMWGDLELTISIIAASTPALQPV